MKTTEELKELATVAGDQERAGPERVAAFRECDAGRKEAKLGWSKLGLEPDQAKELRTAIEALEGADTVVSSPGTSEATGTADGQTGDAFEATADELNAQADRPSVKAAKSDAESDEAIAKATGKAKKAKAEGAGETRGKLTRLIESLLMDPKLSYLDILKVIDGEFPTAHTTARSIASVAAGMRRKDIAVPMRRPEAKPKEAPAKAAA